MIVGAAETKLGYQSVQIWVDGRFRRVHLIPSKKSDTAAHEADSLYTHVFKLHLFADKIVSDIYAKFTSKSLDRLMELFRVKLKMSSSLHPHTYGASEFMNRMIENYLRFLLLGRSG